MRPRRDELLRARFPSGRRPSGPFRRAAGAKLCACASAQTAASLRRSRPRRLDRVVAIVLQRTQLGALSCGTRIGLNSARANVRDVGGCGPRASRASGIAACDQLADCSSGRYGQPRAAAVARASLSIGATSRVAGGIKEWGEAARWRRSMRAQLVPRGPQVPPAPGSSVRGARARQELARASLGGR